MEDGGIVFGWIVDGDGGIVVGWIAVEVFGWIGVEEVFGWIGVEEGLVWVGVEEGSGWIGVEEDFGWIVVEEDFGWIVVGGKSGVSTLSASSGFQCRSASRSLPTSLMPSASSLSGCGIFSLPLPGRLVSKSERSSPTRTLVSFLFFLSALAFLTNLRLCIFLFIFCILSPASSLIPGFQ